MGILLENEFALSDESIACIEQMVKATVKYENFSHPFEVSISIVSDEEIHDLNLRFRNMDKPTDVLSFPLLTFEVDEILQPNEVGEVLLGDIVISIDTAKRQANEYGHSLLRELGFLTVHSTLHLLGYDHMNAEEEEEMFRKQREILEEVGLER
ncbi:MAG: rRNA maturation RNase YbeY [Bacillota bacterium]